MPDDAKEFVRNGILIIFFLAAGIGSVTFLAGVTSGTAASSSIPGVVWLIPVAALIALAVIAYHEFFE